MAGQDGWIEPTDFPSKYRILEKRVNRIERNSGGGQFRELIEEQQALAEEIISQNEVIEGVITNSVAVFRQDEEPEPGVDGVPDPIPDRAIWFDTDDDNRPYSWNPTLEQWESTDEAILGDVAEALANVPTIFRQAEPPVAGVGDVPDPIPTRAIWFDTNNGNKPYTWNPVTLIWESTDAEILGLISGAQAAAIAAQEDANQAILDAAAADFTAEAAAIAAAAAQGDANDLEAKFPIASNDLDINSNADNSLLNGNVERLNPLDSTFPEHYVRNGWGVGSAVGGVTSTAQAFDGTRSVLLQVTGTADGLSESVMNANAIPVTPGEKWQIRVRAKTTTGAFGIYIRAKDQNGQEYYDLYENSGVLPSDGWVDLGQDEYVIPPGMFTLRYFVLLYAPLNTIGNDLYLDDFRAKRIGVSVRVADGTVSAPKIAPDAVTEEKLSAFAITAKHTLTGPLIQTTGTPARGIKLSSTQMIGYDAVGAPTFTLNASTGALTLKGAIESGSTITGTTITGTGLQTSSTPAVGVKITNGGIVAYGGGVEKFTVNSSTGVMTATDGIFSGTITAAVVTGTAGIQTSASAGVGVKITNGGIVAYNGGVPRFTVDNNGLMTATDGVFSGSITAATLTGSSGIQTATSGERVVMRNDGSGGIVEFYGGASGETPGSINPTILESGVPILTISTGNTGSLSARSQMFMRAGTGSSSSITLSTYRVDLSASIATVAGSNIITESNLDSNFSTPYAARVRAGEFNGSTNSSAQVTITHNLGFTPNAVFLTGQEATSGSNRHVYYYNNLTSTQMTITVRNTTGGLVSAATRFSWVVFR